MENSDSHYQSEAQDRSTIELVIDQGFLWPTQFFALGLAAILIWIVVHPTSH